MLVVSTLVVVRKDWMAGGRGQSLILGFNFPEVELCTSAFSSAGWSVIFFDKVHRHLRLDNIAQEICPFPIHLDEISCYLGMCTAMEEFDSACHCATDSKPYMTYPARSDI